MKNIYKIGSNGIAEFEGWEIRWAKPIGAAKILERQKCINEAVAKSSSHKFEQNRKYISPKKCNLKKFQSQVMDLNANVVDIALMHMTALQYFIKEKFNATCTFNYLHTVDESAFMCKVCMIFAYIYFYSLSIFFFFLVSNYIYYFLFLYFFR